MPEGIFVLDKQVNFNKVQKINKPSIMATFSSTKKMILDKLHAKLKIKKDTILEELQNKVSLLEETLKDTKDELEAYNKQKNKKVVQSEPEELNLLDNNEDIKDNGEEAVIAPTIVIKNKVGTFKNSQLLKIGKKITKGKEKLKTKINKEIMFPPEDFPIPPSISK